MNRTLSVDPHSVPRTLNIDPKNGNKVFADFCRLRWTVGNAQMLCYQRPFADMRLSLAGRFLYTLTSYGWCTNIMFWILLTYTMVGWVVFQVRPILDCDQ